MFIPRLISNAIIEAQKHFPVIIITGPRQSGKSFLCKHLFPDYNYINLESVTFKNAALTNPANFILNAGKYVVLDEVQNVPQILSEIQVVVDNDKTKKFILTGSNNFSLLKNVTQSMAGRVALFSLLPFSFPEIVSYTSLNTPIENLIFQGLYPGVIADNIPPDLFFENYITTYLERDVRDLLKVKNYLKFDTFIRLLAARCGSEFNASALAKETGVTANTITEWLSILAASYIIYQVKPFYANINKRLTKMPKIYFYDTGILAFLLGIKNPSFINDSPFKGQLFENLAMGEIVKSITNRGKKPDINFYREHSGKEVDALVKTESGIILYEIKASEVMQKSFTKNMDYVESLLPDISQKSIIYDGINLPPALINIRDI